MAPQVKVLARPGGPGLILRTHLVVGENWLLQVALWPLHGRTYTQNKQINVMK